MEGSVALDANLQKALDEVKDGLQKHYDERWNGFQKELESLRERGTKPDDQKVIDLEKRLDEKDESINELKEQLRLLKVDGGLVKAPSSEEPDFKGVFLPQLDRLREEMRVVGPGFQRRAIDTTLFTGGGDLQPETADAFIDLVFDQTTTLSRITTMRMNAPDRNLDELKVATRQLIAATEGTAPSVADSVSTAQHALATKAVVLAEDITLRFLEDNIERGGVEAHIARLIATQFGNDLNDLAWNGDESTGTFLVINKGFSVLFLADSDVNDVDLSSLTTAVDVLSAVMKGMPHQFLAIPDLTYFAPVGFCQNYANELSSRATALGDQVMVNGLPVLPYFGRRVIPESHMNDATAGVDTDELVAFTSASRLVQGVQRNIRVDAQWNGRKRVVEYTLTARTDVEYADGEIVVRGYGLPAGLK